MNIGDTFKVKYPFCKEIYAHYDEDGFVETESWVPKCRDVMVSPEDTGLEADGEGNMLLEIISLHKPGKYPERVFYTRKWEDPNGNVFGRPGLKICTMQKFKQLTSGYYYEYELAESNEK